MMLNRLAMLVLVALPLGLSAQAQSYKVNNIFSDGSVPATTMDANFLNPWAMSVSGTWWISTANSGFNYVIPAATGTLAFKVIIPSASGTAGSTGLPAGSVTTGGAVGMVLPAPNSTKASFLFSTLDGAIAGWNNKLGTANAVTMIVINNRSKGASYPGLAILNIASGGVTSTSYILAPNFSGGVIEVYDSSFAPTTLGSNFVDPSLPAGYSPFSVHVLNNQVYVAYALHTTATPGQTVNGAGNGLVNVFDNTGKFVSRVVTFGNLNAPWGVAIAPANFGVFSNQLMIGNFGDGKINVYDAKTFAYLGQLMDANGKSLTYPSLWELLPGGTAVTGTAAVSGGDTSTVYFTAGLTGEVHGLLAGITNGPTTGSTPTFGFSTSAGSATVSAGNSTTVTTSVVSTNGFTGAVSLACNGLPAAATCSFSPSSLSPSANGVATGIVTIQTAKGTAGLRVRPSHNTLAAGIAFALMLPFAWLGGVRRRGTLPRLLCMMLVFAAMAGFVSGCSDNSTKPTPSTPAGTSTVSIAATAGSITQTSTIALTVQ
jgi:uncharacterized protein (TIGR03118 family)